MQLNFSFRIFLDDHFNSAKRLIFNSRFNQLLSSSHVEYQKTLSIGLLLFCNYRNLCKPFLISNICQELELANQLTKCKIRAAKISKTQMLIFNFQSCEITIGFLIKQLDFFFSPISISRFLLDGKINHYFDFRKRVDTSFRRRLCACNNIIKIFWRVFFQQQNVTRKWQLSMDSLDSQGRVTECYPRMSKRRVIDPSGRGRVDLWGGRILLQLQMYKMYANICPGLL